MASLRPASCSVIRRRDPPRASSWRHTRSHSCTYDPNSYTCDGVTAMHARIARLRPPAQPFPFCASSSSQASNTTMQHGPLPQPDSFISIATLLLVADACKSRGRKIAVFRRSLQHNVSRTESAKARRQAQPHSQGRFRWTCRPLTNIRQRSPGLSTPIRALTPFSADKRQCGTPSSTAHHRLPEWLCRHQPARQRDTTSTAHSQRTRPQAANAWPRFVETPAPEMPHRRRQAPEHSHGQKTPKDTQAPTDALSRCQNLAFRSTCIPAPQAGPRRAEALKQALCTAPSKERTAATREPCWPAPQCEDSDSSPTSETPYRATSTHSSSPYAPASQ